MRFCRLKGQDAIHVGATDDFGTPILIEAERQGKRPEEFVDYWNKRDQKDFHELGIMFNTYDKTSSEENLKLTQHFFKELYQRGYIYKRTVSQPYCENCKKFLPDRYVKGSCKHCGALEQYSDGCEQCGKTLDPEEIVDPHCSICGSRPANRQSDHYFFQLSRFSSQLEKWLIENKNLQSEVRNYVLNWIAEGLKDWDISRDLSWGIPIPLEEADGKVLYVWFNNHLGYISTALKYFAGEEENGIDAWNSSDIYHFIGKDIVYHHYLFLPAMRMATEEYKLPDFIPTRGYFTLEGRKFSKSRDWYIGVREFLTKFPPDYLRYYLAAITPYSQSDVNFDWKEFQRRINNELIANIGNFIHRVVTFIWSNYKGVVPEAGDLDELDKELVQKLEQTVKQTAEELERIELSKGLRKITGFARFCNQYFQRKKPWLDKEEAQTTINLCINMVRSLGILLEPYIPFSTEKLWNQLNLEGSVHAQDWWTASGLRIPCKHKINKPSVLFRKVQEEEIERERERLASG